jgi:hypothetical protein
MKTTGKMLALLLLLGFFGSSCAAVDRMNAEYEEEAVACDRLSPDAKAECQEALRERDKINWNEYSDGSD